MAGLMGLDGSLQAVPFENEFYKGVLDKSTHGLDGGALLRATWAFGMATLIKPRPVCMTTWAIIVFTLMSGWIHGRCRTHWSTHAYLAQLQLENTR
jgi:hypothetical protein